MKKLQFRQLAGRRAWILVVHREAGHARPVETLLEGAGYEVVSADKPDEIHTLVESGQPDVVVVASGDASILPDDLRRPTHIVIVDANSGSIDHTPRPVVHCTLDGLLDGVSQCLASPIIPSSIPRGEV